MLVNIPAAQIEAVENDAVVSRHAGVVGKPDRPTPLLRSTITELELQSGLDAAADRDQGGPDPQGPEMQKNGAERAREVRHRRLRRAARSSIPRRSTGARRSRQLSYRQQPGKENPLGFLKINFASSSSVYMHDTPKESLFGRNFRAASSGCVRVQNIEELAAWLLPGRSGWDEEQVERDARRAASGTTCG